MPDDFYFYAMNKILTVFLLVLFFFQGTALLAQEKITIKGQVTDSLKHPLEFVNITVKNRPDGTITDRNGRFSFEINASLPITLVSSYIGYTTQETIIHNLSEASTVKIILQAQPEEIEQIEVTGKIKDQTFTKIDPKLVTNLPDASGGNIEGLVKSQMGVASNNELSSQYRVRGGNYDENLVYVNDIEIYRPFLIRSGQQEGLSFVNPNLISSLKFSPGGFEAQYGDKMSSVLDVRYKQPKELQGSVQASLLGLSGHIEGSSKDHRLTAIAGIRYKTNKYLLGTLDVSGEYDPTFLDAQSFITYTFNDNWRLEVLGYYSQNNYHFVPVDRETVFGTLQESKKLKVYFEGQEKDRFQTGLGALSLKHQPNPYNQLKLTASGYRTYEEETYDIDGYYWLQDVQSTTAEPTFPVDGIQNIGVGEHLEHARNDLLGIIQNIAVQGKHQVNNHLLSWEVKYQNERFKDYINEWEMRDSAGYSLPYSDKEVKLVYAYNADMETSSNRTTAYLQDEFSWQLPNGMLLINGGVRMNYWDFNNELLISPRLNLLYYPSGNKNRRFRLATGVYHQSPFYKELRKPNGTINPDIKAQKSYQLVAGYDYIFMVDERPFKFTTEAYYKYLKDIIPYQVDNVRIRYSGENSAKGYAAGIDFKIHGEFVPGVESWANLSLMKTAEDLENDQYTNQDGQSVEPGFIPRPSDQRVNFSLFFQDYLPNNPSFKVHLNALFASGLPFGPPQAPRYMATHRMPAYRRVDIGFSKDLRGKHASPNSFIKDCWLGLEIFNLFDINNTISYYWVSDVHNTQYAVPNYLTSRRFNIKFSVRF